MHAVTLEECFEHRERFLRQLPTWIDKNTLLGYALKTEFTIRRSIHHHVLILLDGSKLCNAEVICHMLGYQAGRRRFCIASQSASSILYPQNSRKGEQQ